MAAKSGLSLVDQTKVVTAASELARNALVHGGGGTAQRRGRHVRPRQKRRQDRLRRRRPGHPRYRPGPDRRLDHRRRARPRPVRRPAAGRRIRADLQARAAAPASWCQVVPLNWPLQAPPPQDMRWLRVEDASAVAACRNAVLTLAGRLEFPAARADQLALAVTEAASNLYKHARQGSLLLCRQPGRRSARDRARHHRLRDRVCRTWRAALRDGHSTAGTLGIGLGAIRRLADFCDLYSVPGHGTALVARFWPAPGAPAGVRCARAWSGRSPARPNAATPTRRSRPGDTDDGRPVRRARSRPAGRRGGRGGGGRRPRASPRASRPRCSSALTGG